MPHLDAGAPPISSTPGCSAAAGSRPGCWTGRRPNSWPGCSAAPPWIPDGGCGAWASKEPGYNPFGHRSGAVRVHETVVAVAGLAAAGYEKEAVSLLRGLLDAAEAFGYRLPEMYAGEQRTARQCAPCRIPAACRPAAVGSGRRGPVLPATLPGIRPTPPRGRSHCARSVARRSARSDLTGLRVAGEPFAVRVSRLGVGMVEEAADGLQLGV